MSFGWVPALFAESQTQLPSSAESLHRVECERDSVFLLSLVVVHSFHSVAFGIMLHSGLCRSALLCHSASCLIRGYVVRHNVTFGIMLHLDLCCSGLWRSV